MVDYSPAWRLRLGKLPQMVHWYDPRLLTRIGIRSMVSTVFGQYADQRLVHAAIDQAPAEELLRRYDFSDCNHPDPGRCVKPDENGAVWVDYVADTGDGFEPTYAVAYMAAQDRFKVAKGELRGGEILICGGDQCYPEGTREDYQRRFIEPFSWAFDAAEGRRKLFVLPGNHDWYDGLAAFDSTFCVARDQFNDGKGLRIGGWVCRQHRSYFAIRLPYNWWIWGTDIQFSKYLDVGQINYFDLVAETLTPDDKIVLCMAQPNWLEAEHQGRDQQEHLYKVSAIARKRGARIATVIAGDWHHYNHYFAEKIGVHFFVAGGGGSFLHSTQVLRDNISVQWAGSEPGDPVTGESLRPTPHAKVDMSLRMVAREIGEALPGRIAERVEVAAEKVEEATRQAEENLRRAGEMLGSLRTSRSGKTYPSKHASRRLSLWNLLFPMFNTTFAVGLGIIYWLMTWQFHLVAKEYKLSDGVIDAVNSETYWHVLKYMPLYWLQAMSLSIAFFAMMVAIWAVLVSYVDISYRFSTFGRYWRKVLVGTLHTVLHVFVMMSVFLIFVVLNNYLAPRIGGWLTTLLLSGPEDIVIEAIKPYAQRGGPSAWVREILGLLYPLQMIPVGGFLGGMIWGLYWVLSGIFANMHTGDAFAALRITSYRNFVKFKFEPDRLTIYPIGLDKVPGRYGWRDATAADHAQMPNRPRLVPLQPLDPHLIEAPIVIRAADLK